MEPYGLDLTLKFSKMTKAYLSQDILSPPLRSLVLTLFLLRGALSSLDDQIQSGIFTVSMARVTKILAFISFHICEVLERLFFEKKIQILKNPLEKNLRNHELSLFLEKSFFFNLNMNCTYS